MQRLTHLVMLLALLLSGPVLPAWAMPCCNGPASLAKTVKVATPHEDAMDGMPSCHHSISIATVIDCARAACLHQNGNAAPASQALAHSVDADATPTLVESHRPALTTGNTAPPKALHPPSPPTAMPLPLRV